MVQQIYTEGKYLEENPAWHIEDSPWKAEHIRRIITQNMLEPKTICEVGCGAGGILEQLQAKMNPSCLFWGYEISPQAFELCQSRSNQRLNFELGDLQNKQNIFFDLMLVIDLIEHLEDYFGFLKNIKPKSEYKIFHIPLDISVQSVLRLTPILNLRESVGHIHYFTKEIALEALKDSGYEIVDYFYTAGYVELPAKSMRNHLARIPRQLLYSIHQDLAVRVMGGYSLMILAK
jgi:cyclopropane fatty-acyl-phospholipid synthase-like methyltransferase